MTRAAGQSRFAEDVFLFADHARTGSVATKRLHLAAISCLSQYIRALDMIFSFINAADGTCGWERVCDSAIGWWIPQHTSCMSLISALSADAYSARIYCGRLPRHNHLDWLGSNFIRSAR